jgi:multisubunit Na+/H+ antiporter MnhF subunit
MPDLIPTIVFVMLAISALLVFWRLVRGPSLPDRVIASDLLGTIAVCLMVVGAGVAGQRAFLDASIVIALIGFVSNIAYARYIEQEQSEDVSPAQARKLEGRS